MLSKITMQYWWSTIKTRWNRKTGHKPTKLSTDNQPRTKGSDHQQLPVKIQDTKDNNTNNTTERNCHQVWIHSSNIMRCSKTTIWCRIHNNKCKNTSNMTLAKCSNQWWETFSPKDKGETWWPRSLATKSRAQCWEVMPLLMELLVNN